MKGIEAVLIDEDCDMMSLIEAVAKYHVINPSNQCIGLDRYFEVKDNP